MTVAERQALARDYERLYRAHTEAAVRESRAEAEAKEAYVQMEAAREKLGQLVGNNIPTRVFILGDCRVVKVTHNSCGPKFARIEILNPEPQS